MGDEEIRMEEKSLKSSVVSGLFWKFAESICADLVSFIVSIILARLLLPSDYGEIALVNVFIVIANVFVVNGLGSALIQKKDADALDFSSVFYANLGFSIFLYLIIFFSSPLVAGFYGIPHLSVVLRVLGIRIPLAAILSIQNAYVSRKMIFRKFFFATIIGTVISAVVGIYMAYNGYGVWALVAQILTNTVIDSLMLTILTRWIPKLQFSFQRLKGLIKYGWKILASSLIKTGYNQLSSLIVGKKYTKEDLAFYTKGKQYPELIVTNIDSSINSVLFPAISKRQTDIEKVKSMTRRSMKTSTYIMCPLLFGLAAISAPLISLMLTDKWLFCVPYLKICCFYYVMQPVSTANLQAIKAIGRSDVILKLDIIKRGAGLAFLLSLMWFGPIYVALAPVGMTIVATIVNAIANKKLINYKYKEQVMDLFPIFSLALVMFGVVYGLSLLFSSLGLANVFIVIIGVCVGGLVYLILSLIFKVDSFRYILNSLKGFFKKTSKKEKLQENTDTTADNTNDMDAEDTQEKTDD